MDLVIKNGHVIDIASGIDGLCDVGVKGAVCLTVQYCRGRFLLAVGTPPPTLTATARPLQKSVTPGCAVTGIGMLVCQ